MPIYLLPKMLFLAPSQLFYKIQQKPELTLTTTSLQLTFGFHKEIIGELLKTFFTPIWTRFQLFQRVIPVMTTLSLLKPMP